MPLSDMPIQRYAFIRYAAVTQYAGVARERSSRGDGTHHGFCEVIGARADLREPFGYVRLDMRIGRAGAARRGERKLA